MNNLVGLEARISEVIPEYCKKDTKEPKLHVNVYVIHFSIYAMHRFFQKWLLLIYLICPFQGLVGQSALLQKEIAEIIRYEANIDFTVVPGVLVGVIDGDSTYVCSFGQRMDKDSMYELGSLTKPVIAWLAQKALDSLGWGKDASVCLFLPDSLCRDGWHDLTVEDLILHHSGMPRFPPGADEKGTAVQDPYASYDILHFAHDLQGISSLPGQYSYSHLAYGMLYWLFERVGGLESFAHRMLIGPLALQHTGWIFPDYAIAQGHGLDGRVQPPWHCNALSTAMGLKSSMSELMIFLKSVFSSLAVETPELTSALRKEMNLLSKSGAYKVVGGWFLIQSGDELVFYHTGRTGGHQVSVAFIPEKEKGVVVISNGAPGSNELSLLVLNMVNRAK